MTLTMHVMEHRNHPRIHCHLTGSIREMDSARVSETLSELRRKNASVVLYNVSLGGACLETDKPMDPGHIIRLEFSLPSHGVLATFAEVCWVNARKVGMRFLALPEKGTTSLRKFVLRENIVHHHHPLIDHKNV